MRSIQPAAIEGLLAVDKPQDWTSHDVVAFVRKRFKIKKVGHAGTLDPMATGLLVLLLGQATKLSSVVSACDKEYVGVMRLGLGTDSHDRTGRVLEERPWDFVSLEGIRSQACAFEGDILQTPPMISALKYKGERLYKLARRGQIVPRSARRVRVHRLSIESLEGPYVHFLTCVSKGTYVRTLVNDLGESLKCLATLEELHRTRLGNISVDNSLTISELKQMTVERLGGFVLPLQTALDYATANQP